MNRYLLLADAVAVLHGAYVAFVTVGFALIVIGIAMRGEWVRAFWFRAVHLGAIALVCAESLMGAACPLTTFEGRLRGVSDEAGHSRDFIGYWVDRLIYYDFPSWVFTVAYGVFGILVTIAFILAPPRWPGRRIAACAKLHARDQTKEWRR
jgi:hypothetical protein